MGASGPSPFLRQIVVGMQLAMSRVNFCATLFRGHITGFQPPLSEQTNRPTNQQTYYAFSVTLHFPQTSSLLISKPFDNRTRLFTTFLTIPKMAETSDQMTRTLPSIASLGPHQHYPLPLSPWALKPLLRSLCTGACALV